MEDNKEYYVSVPEKKNHAGLFILIGMLLGAALASFVVVLLLGNGTVSQKADGDGILSEEAVEKIRTIEEQLDRYFLFREDMEEADTDTAMIKAYVEALGDPYTVYYTKEEYDSLMESTSGTYAGIGSYVSQNTSTGVITIVRPFENAPAYQAGIRANDIIYKVNGEEVTGKDLSLVVADMKGEPGTTVDIEVYRPDTGEYIDFTVTRAIVEVETIQHEMLEDGIGYIYMSSFDDVTYKQFMAAYEDLASQGMKGLIVDLRDNGGGLLSSVLDILDEMLPACTMTYTIDLNENRQDYKSDAGYTVDVPLVVLVGGNTASASEIFTAAVQDYDLGEIVGEQTFGKGIVQTILSEEDGSGLKVTTSRYYTPNGVCIHGEGIAPDVSVTDDVTTAEDEVLEEGIRVLLENME